MFLSIHFPLITFRNPSGFHCFPLGPYTINPNKCTFLSQAVAELAKFQSLGNKDIYVKAINPLCLLIITHTPTHPWPWLNWGHFKVWASLWKQRNISHIMLWPGGESCQRGKEKKQEERLFHFSGNLYLHQNQFRIYDIVFHVCVWQVFVLFMICFWMM